MNVKLLTEHHVQFLSFKGDSTKSSESTLVKMPLFWKSHVAAQGDDVPPGTDTGFELTTLSTHYLFHGST